MKNKTTALLLCLALLSTCGLTALSASSDDPSPWAQAQVGFAIEMGLVPQTLQSNYKQATTRAEFCALAVTLYETFTGEEITDRLAFDDTNDVYVEKAAAVGIVLGVEPNKFAPNDDLTREQAAVMLVRVAFGLEKPFPKQAPPFNDSAKISPWASEQVGQAYKSGIMDGVGNNTFAPKDPYTREQSILTIYRTYVYLLHSEGVMDDALTAITDIPTAPWQDAYIKLLQKVFDEDEATRNDPGKDTSELSDSYGLYDVDKDGVPELFINYGDAEANYWVDVYTYKNGAAVSIGELAFGHAMLHTFPGENAAVITWGHMGYQEMHKITIADGKIKQLEVLFEEELDDSDDWYTPVSDIVPGAEYVTFSRTAVSLPYEAPLTLPVYYYGNGGHATGSSSEIAKAAITEVLDGKRDLYGVTSDGYGGDTGWMSFKAYCQPGGVSKYSQVTMIPQYSKWIDMNKDGQNEYVVMLSATDNSSSDIYVILSYQDNIVYAYCLNYVAEYSTLRQDGTFYIKGEYGQSDYMIRYTFYKNQCYSSYVYG